MNKPNLFNWATSELSQDAFICWLLSWANYPESVELNKTAKYLIETLTDNQIKRIEKIEIRIQRNIDLLCIVNNEYAILIEEKANIKHHSNQLENCLTILSEDFPREKIFPIYYSIGNQSNFELINKAGYKLYLRQDFIEVLSFGKNQGVTNSIYLDFYDYLIEIEGYFQSFKTLPIYLWGGDSWEGFYTELQKQLSGGTWGEIPRNKYKSIGFWWHCKEKEFEGTGFDYYLQIESWKLCFKLYPYKRGKEKQIRDYYRGLLYSKAKECNIEIYQNGRIGERMTVAALKKTYLAIDNKGFLDMEKTINTIKNIQNMLDKI